MTALLPDTRRIGGAFFVREGGRAALSAFGLLIGLWYGADLPGDAWALHRDTALWRTGTVAAEPVGQLQVSRGGLVGVLATHVQAVRYVDAAGEMHIAFDSFGTLLADPPSDPSTPEIRYDPRAPDRFVTSWAREAAGARLSRIGFFAFVLVMLVAMLGRDLVRFGRRARTVRRCVHRGHEVVVRLVGFEPVHQQGRPTSRRRYTLGIDGGTSRTWTDELDASRFQPLYADAAGTTAFALRCQDAAGDDVILLRSDLYPLALTDAERRQVEQRVDDAVGRTR